MDGVLIVITNRGLRRGPKEVSERLGRGEPVDPSQYYFRTSAEFEAPQGSPMLGSTTRSSSAWQSVRPTRPSFVSSK
jgi:hypothetical protein